MSSILAIFLYLTANTRNYEPVNSICESNVDHLSIEKKVDFAIGCSTVKGTRVYSDYKLEEILRGACPTPTSSNCKKIK